MPAKKKKQPLSVTHPELAKEADGWDPSLSAAALSAAALSAAALSAALARN